jgi:hypothetical protein
VLIAIALLGLIALVVLAVLIGLARDDGVGAVARSTVPRSTDETSR